MSAATHLLGVPQEATAALEFALSHCPRPTFFGGYAFATHAQRARLDELLATRYLLPFEFKWVSWVRINFDVATADTVIQLLERIVSYRQATGVEPVYRERGYYYPDTPPVPLAPAYKPRKPRS